jgi:hypothetical protein
MKHEIESGTLHLQGINKQKIENQMVAHAIFDPIHVNLVLFSL